MADATRQRRGDPRGGRRRPRSRARRRWSTRMKVFTDQVASGKVPARAAPATAGGDSGGGGGLPWLYIAARRRRRPRGAARSCGCGRVSRERRKRARVGSIGTARSFHAARLDALSLRHSELVRAVGERPDDPALAEHHQTAGAKLVALRRQLPQLYSPRELRTCAGELDLTEWHIECAEALAEGRGLPPQPSPDRPALCFFTHEHGLGTVEVDVTRPDGTVAVGLGLPGQRRRAVAGRAAAGRCRARRRPPGAVADRAHVLRRRRAGRPRTCRASSTRGARSGVARRRSATSPSTCRPTPSRACPPRRCCPPGVATPLPPGVTAPLIDEDALPPGVSVPPPLPEAAERDRRPGRRRNGSPNGAAAVRGARQPRPARARARRGGRGDHGRPRVGRSRRDRGVRPLRGDRRRASPVGDGRADEA